jgi:aminoglycoside phosphotransferase (APT) family kinase protein
LPDLRWYFAYNLFRRAGIVQGVKKRLADGNVSSTNAKVIAATVGPLADAAWAQAQQSSGRLAHRPNPST